MPAVPQLAVAETQPLRLGELLIAENIISRADLQRAQEFQARFGGRLGGVLVRMGAASEDALLNVLARQLDMPVASAAEIPLQSLAATVELSGIEREWWLDQEIVAWESADGAIHCLTRNPLEVSLHEVLAAAFEGKTLVWRLARNQDLDRALESLARSGAANVLAGGDDAMHLRELAEGAPVVEFVNNMMSQAIDQRASDVHIEPEERQFFVRYRIDGILREHLNLPKDRYSAVASRIKLISGLDIAERRLPQDGRLNLRVSGQELDIRVSTLPGVHGESIVMRLLPKERQASRLEHLGFAPDHLRLFTQWAAEPNGIILVTGPTGSGKSTTLYATLDAVNDRKQKIITVEDPVEYQLQGVTQVQAHADIGYTFARALRSILRQDPDVIMIGEIRDLETAEIAVQAALTGHLVFSTLHTNDALSAFTRLIDMGVEPFLVASAVRAVQAQRLLRRLCSCAQPATPPPDIAAATVALLPEEYKNLAPAWKHPAGCPDCQHSGYRGRVGVYEMAYLTPELQHLILQRAPLPELQQAAARGGFRNLRHDGWIKAYQGITSLEEVMRVTDTHTDF